MLKKIFRKLHIIHNIYIKHKFFIKKKSYAMDNEDRAFQIILKIKKMGFMLMLDVIIQHIEIIPIYFIKKIGME